MKNEPLQVKMPRTLFLLVFLIGILNSHMSIGQEKISYFLGQYLVKVGELDSAIYQVKKGKRRDDVITNYYVLRIDTFKLGNDKFVLCKFGSYSDHSRPHLSLVNANNFDVNCTVDCTDIGSALQKLLDFLNSFSRTFERGFEGVKTGIVKRFIKEYPDYPYWRSL